MLVGYNVLSGYTLASSQETFEKDILEWCTIPEKVFTPVTTDNTIEHAYAHRCKDRVDMSVSNLEEFLTKVVKLNSPVG